MTEILLFYIAALLVCALGFAATFIFLKNKLQAKFRWGSFFIGVIAAVVYFLIILLLFKASFSNDNYYNTAWFRALVGFVYVALLALARLMLVKGCCFNRYKEDQGYSFSFGFGCAPLAFLAIYCLIMIFVVGGNGIFNGPAVVEKAGYLSFADNTIISVFRPAAGHLSFAILFLFVMIMVIASGHCMHRLCEQQFSLAISVGWVVMLVVLEALALVPVPFITMFRLAHWQLAVIAGFSAAVSVVLAFFMPQKQKPANYTKQFE